MAEQTPPSNSDSPDLLRKRTHQDNQSGDDNLTAGQKTLPPKRGLLKRSKGSSPAGGVDASRRVTRTPIARQQASPVSQQTPASQILTPPPSPFAQSPPQSPSQKAPTPPGRPSPGATRPAPSRTAVRAPSSIASERQAKNRLDKRLLEAEERRKASAERKKIEEERAAARQAAKEKRQQAKALAAKKAEEQRIERQKELARKKAEAEKLRLEKEAEAKRLEEVRLKKEKEEEVKRLEEEKKLQAQERERILKSIESYRGKLSEKEQELAETIADEMVKRNVHWEGYISLHSGIGGAMLS